MDKKDVISIVGDKLMGRIPEDKHDRTIIIATIVCFVLWIIDLFIPDPLPILDEVILGVISYLFTLWYTKRKK